MRFFFLFLYVLMGLICISPHGMKAQAATPDTLHAYDVGAVPIMHEGRLKPLQSYAHYHYKNLSDVFFVDDEDALDWLMLVLFDPKEAAETPIIAVKNKALKKRLGLNEATRRFAVVDIIAALEPQRDVLIEISTINNTDLTAEQQALLALSDKVAEVTQLMQSFSMFLPLSIDMPQDFAGDRAVQPFYTDLRKNRPALEARVEALIKQKGANLELYTEEEARAAALYQNLRVIEQGGAQSLVFKIMPPLWVGQGDVWQSPWEKIITGTGDPFAGRYLTAWQNLSDAYRLKDQKAVTQAVHKLTAMINDHPAVKGHAPHLRAEIWFLDFHLPGLVLLGYVMVCLLLLARRFMRDESAQAAFVHYLGLYGAMAVTMLHGVMIAARVFILQRPPVATLYESLIFVVFVMMVTALFMVKRKNNALYLLMASAMGLFLMVVAATFLSGQDTMQMLVPVLNTNFWLATHVIIITAGYGFCLMTALMAHLYLIKQSAALMKHMIVIAVVSLLFTAVGTILGGIWADQSWGRFWGWDPKENGALLIVLWLVWVLHGRLCGVLKPLGVAAWLACLTMVVGVAWFGVNLLNVGLHSYGFTSGLAWGLMGFCAFETGLIGVLYTRAHMQKGK